MENLNLNAYGIEEMSQQEMVNWNGGSCGYGFEFWWFDDILGAWLYGHIPCDDLDVFEYNPIYTTYFV